MVGRAACACCRSRRASERAQRVEALHDAVASVSMLIVQSCMRAVGGRAGWPVSNLRFLCLVASLLVPRHCDEGYSPACIHAQFDSRSELMRVGTCLWYALPAALLRTHAFTVVTAGRVVVWRPERSLENFVDWRLIALAATFSFAAQLCCFKLGCTKRGQ